MDGSCGLVALRLPMLIQLYQAESLMDDPSSASTQLAQCICYNSCSVGVQEINTLSDTEVVECLACLSGRTEY